MTREPRSLTVVLALTVMVSGCSLSVQRTDGTETGTPGSSAAAASATAAAPSESASPRGGAVITDTKAAEKWALNLTRLFYDYTYAGYAGRLDITQLEAAAKLLDPSAVTVNVPALQTCLGRKIDEVRRQAGSPTARTSYRLRSSREVEPGLWIVNVKTVAAFDDRQDIDVVNTVYLSDKGALYVPTLAATGTDAVQQIDCGDGVIDNTAHGKALLKRAHAAEGTS